MHEADIALPFASAAVASTVARALAVELADAPEGARVTLDVEGSMVTAHITAPELSALRAAMTGFVRLADAASRSAIAK